MRRHPSCLTVLPLSLARISRLTSSQETPSPVLRLEGRTEPRCQPSAGWTRMAPGRCMSSTTRLTTAAASLAAGVSSSLTKQLNSMTRFFGLLRIGGVGLIVMGAYGFFIQADTSSTPTTVSIADLERAAPSDRHLIVTGGRALVNDAIVYYETRRYAKVPGSEAHFIPIQDASLATYHSLTPSLLLRITGAQMDAIKKGAGFDARAIHGVRMTQWDLEGEVRELQTMRYGEAAVKKMVNLQYENEVTGTGGGLGQMVLGAVCIVGAVVFAGLTNKSKT